MAPKRRISLLAATAFTLVVVGCVLYPFLCRRATYDALREMIKRGEERRAIDQVHRLSRKTWFKPDWTPRSAMPSWRWVHELDFRLFGCPSCRGDWATLLHCAAGQGQTALVATLITNGASVSFYGDRGCQALMSAVGGGNTNVIATLLAHGADINATNFFGPVMHAAAQFCQKPEMLQFLLDAGAKPNVLDGNGWTALDRASVWNAKAQTILLANGAIASTNRRIPLPRASQLQAIGAN